MSGKTARRLRRITEQATTGQKGCTTISPTDTASYKEHKVQSNKRHEHTPLVTTTIRTQRNSPRAFYQEVKKAYKDGSGKAEAKKIQQEYREEQKLAAKRIANEIAAIVEQPRFPKQASVIDPMAWLEAYVNWLADGEESLGQALPFQAISTLSSVEAGYITITGLQNETQHGVMFVISSAGYIRAYDGEVINILNIDKAEETYRKVTDILTQDLKPFAEIKNMEIIDAQQE